MYGISSWGISSDLQVGLGFGPGFGQQPHPASEPVPVHQLGQPDAALMDYADTPSRPAPGVAVSRSQRLGRGPQAAWGYLPVKCVFHSGPKCQGQQSRHRQLQPMLGDARRISRPGFPPLPLQALEGLEARFYPETERIPTGARFPEWKVSRYDPRLLLLGVPDRRQGATAFCGGCAESSPAPGPRGIRTGNEGPRLKAAAPLGIESGVFRIPDAGIPALSAYLALQFRTGQAPVAQRNHGHVHRRGN